MAEPIDRRWEYRFVRILPSQPADQGTALLGDLGRQGWRVVHVVPTENPAVVQALLERALEPPDAST